MVVVVGRDMARKWFRVLARDRWVALFGPKCGASIVPWLWHPRPRTFVALFSMPKQLSIDIPRPSGSRCTSHTFSQHPYRSSRHLSSLCSTCLSGVREHQGRSRCSLGWYRHWSCWLSRSRWRRLCCVDRHQWQRAYLEQHHLGLDGDRGTCRR